MLKFCTDTIELYEDI